MLQPDRSSDQPMQLEHALRNAPAPEPALVPDQERLPEGAWHRVEFYRELVHYYKCLAVYFEGMILGPRRGEQQDAERQEALDQRVANNNTLAEIAGMVDALYDKVEWRDDDEIDFVWSRGEDDEDDNGNDERGTAGEVAGTPEAPDH